MKRALSVFVLLMFAASMSFAKTQKQDKDKYGVNAQGSQKITNGPVIESVSDHSAMIAWSTKSAGGTYVAYGKDKNNLDQKTTRAWGGTRAGSSRRRSICCCLRCHLSRAWRWSRWRTRSRVRPFH